MRLESIPKIDGYRMIPEYFVNGSPFFLFPTRPDNWRENAYHAQKAYVELVEEVSKFKKVVVGFDNVKSIPKSLNYNSNIASLVLQYDDVWIRDTGPIFLLNDKGGVRGVKWGFNAWGGSNGGLYSDWNNDLKLPKSIFRYTGLDYYQNDMILEGGSVLTDNLGNLYTTESCLLNKNRNPHLNKKEIEDNLKLYLGANKVVWLPSGLRNDETGGHVDNLISIVRDGSILIYWTEDKDDPQYEIVHEAYKKILKEFVSIPFNLEIIKLEAPEQNNLTQEETSGLEKKLGTYERHPGDYVISSYMNVYIDSNLLLLPQFGDKKKDENAFRIYSKLLPKHKIIRFYSREIVIGGGGVHCITLGVPN